MNSAQDGIDTAIEITVRLRRVPSDFEVLVGRIPMEQIRVAENLPAAALRIGAEILMKDRGPADRGGDPATQKQLANAHEQSFSRERAARSMAAEESPGESAPRRRQGVTFAYASSTEERLQPQPAPASSAPAPR